MTDIKILVDNNSASENLKAEFGFSSYIKSDNKKILFDTGESGCFIDNARNLGLDLFDLDYVALSHGHHDHSNGLISLVKMYNDEGVDIVNRPTLVAHPDAFLDRYERDTHIGCALSYRELKENFRVVLSEGVFDFGDDIFFLGEIPRKNDFEAKDPIGEIVKDGMKQDDYVMDDSAIVYKSKDGLVVVSGCAHSGICNTVDYAKQETNQTNVLDVIGGFHLAWSLDEYIKETADKLAEYNIRDIYSCHCTGERAVNMFTKDDRFRSSKIGSGYIIRY